MSDPGPIWGPGRLIKSTIERVAAMGVPASRAMNALDGPTWTTLGFLAAVFGCVLWLVVAKLRQPTGDVKKLDLDWENVGMSWRDLISENPRIGIALNQIEAACDFFRAKREKAKRDAELVLIATYLANGLIMVIGVAVNFDNWAKLGIVSTALAALVAGLAAWDAHYRNRDLWIERTIILSRFEKLHRQTRYRLAQNEDPNTVADDAMRHVELLLDEDMKDWSAMRDSKPDSDRKEWSPNCDRKNGQ
jgi:hypothetical protein